MDIFQKVFPSLADTYYLAVSMIRLHPVFSGLHPTLCKFEVKILK